MDWTKTYAASSKAFYLSDIETARLLAIEIENERKRMFIINRDLNTEFRLTQLSLDNKLKIQLNLFSQKEDLDSFYEIDESSKVESIPSIVSVNSIDSMPKQIPLETTTPILLILGVGLVSYYLLKGNKK